MTWLEIMDVLDNMPLHLLKKEAELWRYDAHGNYEIMPIHNLVNPNDDGESPEWKKGGAFSLSFQSFEDEPKPETKKKYLVDVTMLVPFSFYMEAKDYDEAKEKASTAMWSEAFFDSIKDDIDFKSELVEETMFNTMEWSQIQEDNNQDVDPIDVDSFPV